eukprot:271266_1
MALVTVILQLPLFITLFAVYTVFGSECSESDIFHVDWPALNSHGVIPDYGYNIEFDQFNLEVVIDVNLTYLGYSVDEGGDKLGTSYILDFESKEAHIVPLNEPGTCSNRNFDDFDGVDFTDWFEYSTVDPPEVGVAPYLAYPPNSDDWFIDSLNCKTITYKGHFSFKELYNECTNYAGTDTYSVLTTDDEWINLTLTFYINIVSPLSNNVDTGFYRIYQLLSAPFVVAIHKTIEVLQPIGIRLFTMSVIAVYKENDQHDFRLAVVTETAEYLKLSSPQLVTYPWDLETNHQIHFQISDEFVDPLTETAYAENPCLNNKAYFCSQIWEIYADDVPCPPSDFSGLYGLRFTAICNDDGSTDATVNEQRTTSCDIWLDSFDETVDLSTELTWTDEICDAEVWTVHFGGTTRYYSDGTYTTLNDETHLYKISESERVYVETEVLVPSGAYNVFQATLVNVWLCTTDPLDGEPALDTSTGEGGCLSAGIDDDGPYHIIQNYDDVLLYNATHESTANVDSNIVRYSFIPPISLRRDTLYIHAQITLSLVSKHGRRLKEIQIDVGGFVAGAHESPKTDQIKHFMSDIAVDTTGSQPYEHIKEIEAFKRKSGFYDEPIGEYDEDDDKDEIDDKNNEYWIESEDKKPQYPYMMLSQNALREHWLTVLGIFIGVLAIANIGCLTYSNYKKCRPNVEYNQQWIHD